MPATVSQSSWQRLVSGLAEGVLVVDLDGVVLFANRRAGELFGRAPEALQGEPFAYPVAVEGRQEVELLAPSGDTVAAEITVRRGAWEEADAWVVTVHDMTHSRRVMERLRLAASVFSHAREGIVITDRDGVIIDVNAAFTEVTGYERREVLGGNPRILKSNRHGTAFYEQLWDSLLTRGVWRGEIWNRRRNGEVYPELLTISAIRDDQGELSHYVGMFFDISEQKEQERRLEHIAHYDPLTDLPNRVLLSDRLFIAMVQAKRSEYPLAVVYVDLDDFKAVNDHYGHEVGDQLLVTVAWRLRTALRAGDTVARLGGDEFVVVLSDCSTAEESRRLVRRLQEGLRLPVTVDGLSLRITASFGVTFYPQREELDADQLLRQADQAMYQAKLTGKDHSHLYDARIEEEIKAQHEQLEAIRRALAGNEFELYYQPKVNMRSGAVVGLEALIRWPQPDGSVLPPGAFLPAIEKHPLAVELGEWVIDQALRQLDTWRRQGLEVPVSINIGALHLQRDDFVERLRGLLAAHPDVPPRHLQMEVLETSALEDMAHASAVMNTCAELGVTFALDDFGIGYSSLTYLKQLPATELKIDRSFVQNMLDDPEDLAILEGVIGLATAFQRQVIAEGVESLDHGETLLQLGCDMAQGYAIARPMPASEVPAWIPSWIPAPQWRHVAPVARENLPVLFAGAEHNAWLRALREYVEKRRDAPPPMDAGRCRFGRWLTGAGRERYGASEPFRRIEALHRQMHATAAALVNGGAAGAQAFSAERLQELEDTSEALRAQLHALLSELQQSEAMDRRYPVSREP